MSDYGEIQDEQTGLNSQHQNSISTWATRLRDNATNKASKLYEELFDDSEYGIYLFCNPTSLLQRLFQFERPEPPRIDATLEIIYADSDIRIQVNNQTIWTAFNRFMNMCKTLHIQSNAFPSQMHQQVQWVCNIIVKHNMHTLNQQLFSAQQKLGLLTQWFAVQDGMIIDKWKRNNTEVIERVQGIYARLARLKSLFATRSWFHRLKPKQNLPIQWHRINNLDPAFLNGQDLDSFQQSLSTFKLALSYAGISIVIPNSEKKWISIWTSATQLQLSFGAQAASIIHRIRNIVATTDEYQDSIYPEDSISVVSKTSSATKRIVQCLQEEIKTLKDELKNVTDQRPMLDERNIHARDRSQSTIALRPSLRKQQKETKETIIFSDDEQKDNEDSDVQSDQDIASDNSDVEPVLQKMNITNHKPANLPMNSMKKPFNKNEQISKFDSATSDSTDAYRFQKTFLKHATHFEWVPNSTEFRSELKSYVDAATWAWYKDLPKAKKKSYKAFQQSWSLKFIQNRVPKRDSYQYATQMPKESLENFMYRFNALAVSAKLDITSPKIWRHHYMDWCEKLTDRHLSQQFLALNLPSKDALAEYVEIHESRKLRSQYIQSNIENVRKKSHANGSHVYSMTASSDVATSDTSSNVSYPSTSISELGEIETAQIMALKASGKSFKLKEFCKSCGIEHFLFDGKCYQKQPCPLCQINGHPAESCFQRCRLSECNKIQRHHQDKCPRLKIRDEELQNMKDINQQLLDILKKHGIESPDSTLKE